MSKIEELIEVARELPSEVVDNLLRLARQWKKRTSQHDARTPLTPEERVKRFQEWANQDRPLSPSLSDELLRREHLYE